MARKDEIIPKIQQAALEQFLKVGIEGSTMEGIAKAANTTKRTLYKYYGSKEIIYSELIGLLLDQFDAYSDFQYSGDRSIDEQIDEIIESKIALMVNDDYVKMSKLVSIELIKSNPIDQAHFNKFYKSEKKLVRWIKEAQEDGRISSEQSPQLIANQFLSIIKGQIFHPVLFGMSKVSKKEVIDCRQTARKFLTSYLQKKR